MCIRDRAYSQVSATWTVSVRPQAVGDYEIPPVTVEAAGQRFTTEALHLTVVQDITGEDLGYLEIQPSATRVYEGQPVSIELLFGWDAATEVNFAELNLPWWGALSGAIELAQPDIAPDRRASGIVVNRSTEVVAEQLEPRMRNGRRFLALRLVKNLLPTRPGKLEFSSSFFQFGLRSRAFFERRQRDQSHFVQAQPFALEVLPLPSEGQPLDFSGAVGALAVRAAADVRDVRVGDSIKLTVDWTGQGNLEYFRAPDPAVLDAFRAFKVYGATEEKGPGRRRVVYDLAPLSTEVSEIPPLALSVFDPTAERYTALTSEPIPIRVRALERTNALGDEEQAFERDIADIDARPLGAAGERGGPGTDRFLVAAVLGVPLLGLLTRARVRRTRGDPSAPLEQRRRLARRRLAQALERAGDAPAQRAAFLEYLAARTRESATAWDGRDLAQWARRARSRPSLALATRLASELARLDAAVFGGGALPERAALLAGAEALEKEGL